MQRLFFTILVLLSLSFSELKAQPQAASDSTGPARNSAAIKKRDIKKIFEEVFIPPFDEARFQAYKDVLPRVGNYFIVEGDIRLSESELRGYVVSRLTTQETDERHPELTAMKKDDGKPSKYEDLAARKLTYAIDRLSFPDAQSYELVRRNLQTAAKEWMDICPECQIEFLHLSNFDQAVHQNISASVRDQIKFVVRQERLGGSYVALAFFPHDPPLKKVLQIDPVYFSPGIDPDYLVGVFRHELGHILGYRHEQVRGVMGCRLEENSQAWIPISVYDPKSVMHYPCGKGGTATLSLSDTDKTSHRAWYWLPKVANESSISHPVETSAANASETSAAGSRAGVSYTAQTDAAHESTTLVVRFEGADIASNAVKVITAFVDLGLIQKGSYTIKEDDRIEDLYSKLLKLPESLPLYSVSIRGLANSVNGANISGRTLKPGAPIFYPKIEFDGYHYSRRYDLSVPAQREEMTTLRKFEPLLVGREKSGNQQATAGDDDSVKLRLIGYEIKVKIPTEEMLDKATRVLNELTLKNIRWAVNTSKKPSYHSSERTFLGSEGMPITTQDARGFWSNNSVSPSQVPVNNQGDLGVLVGMPPLAKRPGESIRPEVVIVDQPIYMHPNLVNVFVNQMDEAPDDEKPLKDSTSTPPSVHSGFYTFSVGKFLKDSHHGTHLAGIVASRNNGFGLMGVNPRAALMAVNWNYFKNNQQKLADRLETMSRPPKAEPESPSPSTTIPQPIFLFADSWVNKTYQASQREKDILADQIIQIGALWVVAAGNTDANDKETEIGPSSAYPMNLGNQSMVLVVTACERCDNNNLSQAQIMQGAKISTSGFVHIAAPGDDIPSTIADGKYATAPGTSQAAALVAGIVSAMVSAKPFYYGSSYRIKKWLQITSRPFPYAADRGKLATGIVDAEAAMRDPERDWVRPKASEMMPVDHFKWLVPDLTFYEPETGKRVSAGKLEYIYRIFKRNDEFYLYTKSESARAPIWEVKLLGPFSVAAQDLEADIFKCEVTAANGKTTMVFKLKEIEDLILSK